MGLPGGEAAHAWDTPIWAQAGRWESSQGGEWRYAAGRDPREAATKPPAWSQNTQPAWARQVGPAAPQRASPLLLRSPVSPDLPEGSLLAQFIGGKLKGLEKYLIGEEQTGDKPLGDAATATGGGTGGRRYVPDEKLRGWEKKYLGAADVLKLQPLIGGRPGEQLPIGRRPRDQPPIDGRPGGQLPIGGRPAGGDDSSEESSEDDAGRKKSTATAAGSSSNTSISHVNI